MVPGHECVSTHAILEPIEFVNDNANEEVKKKDVAHENEANEVNAFPSVGVPFGLEVNAAGVYACVHHVKPPFRRHHLEKN